MERRRLLPVVFLLSAASSCGSNDAEQIIALQKQIALLTRQVEHARKELETLHEADRTAAQSLNALEAEVNRLAALEALPPPAAQSAIEEADIAPPVALGTASAPRPRAEGKLPVKEAVVVPCSRVWVLLGKGASDAAAAKALNTSVDRVQACEQEVGRGARREQ